MRQRLSILLAVCFFLGFPLLGLVFVWKYAHRNIELSADTVSKAMVTEVLQKWDTKSLDEVATLNLRESNEIKAFVAQKDSFGDFVAIENWRPVKTSVGQRSEAIWQQVRYVADVDCEKSDAHLDVVLARRTMNPEWRIEEFRLKPR